MTEQQDIPTLHYVDRLKEVRALPRKSPEERHRKWEEMRDLKIETMLSYALLADMFVREVEQNPSVSLQELESKALRYKKSLSRPQVIGIFLQVFKIEREKTTKALNHFRKEASLTELKDPFNDNFWAFDEKQEVAERVFVSVTGKKPLSPVNLLITPLGIGIQTNSKSDFKLLDKKRNIGGYYNYAQPLTTNRNLLFIQTKYTTSFPLIVSGSNDNRILRHEVGHAINRIVMYTISNAVNNNKSFDNVWGGLGFLDPLRKTISNVDSLGRYLKESVRRFAISSAKDEILTDFIASGNFSHVANLVEEGGLYDYFQHAIDAACEKGVLKLPKDEIQRAKNILWEEYKTQIKDNVKFAEEVIMDYKRERVFDRVRLIPYVLAQVPILKWKNFLSRFFYSETAAIYHSIANAQIELQKKRASITNLNQINWFSSFIKSKEAESKHPSTKSIYKVAKELDTETEKFSRD